MKHYRLPALLLAGAMTFGLASCGSSSSGSASSAAASGSGVFCHVFWPYTCQNASRSPGCHAVSRTSTGRASSVTLTAVTYPSPPQLDA